VGRRDGQPDSRADRGIRNRRHPVRRVGNRSLRRGSERNRSGGFGCRP
jgi:hypothetical protein